MNVRGFMAENLTETLISGRVECIRPVCTCADEGSDITDKSKRGRVLYIGKDRTKYTKNMVQKC